MPKRLKEETIDLTTQVAQSYTQAQTYGTAIPQPEYYGQVGDQYYMTYATAPEENQKAKQDAGKPKLSLVPPQVIRDIAEVREYGNRKYGDSENWKTVEKRRYIDALYRHLLAYIEDPNGVDSESGIKHYKHIACNIAFICAMEAEKEKK